MPTYTSRYTQSSVNSNSKESSVTFGTDIQNSNVYLSVDIKPSRSFARLMLILGRIGPRPIFKGIAQLHG